MSSPFELEVSVRECRMSGIYTGPHIGTDSFAREFLAIQAAQAYEELGDVLVEGEEFVEQALQSSGMTSMDRAKARSVAAGIIGCLQLRYNGECAVADCRGRQIADELINGIS